MNKWRTAGDEVAFRANQEVWRQFASQSRKLRYWFKLANGLGPKQAGNTLTLTARKLVDGLAPAKELGKKLERSIRRTIRRSRKPTMANDVRDQANNRAV
jgi:hypothetical protein